MTTTDRALRRSSRRWIPALAAGEIRRDVAALDRRAVTVVPRASVERAWSAWPWGAIDDAWGDGDEAALEPFDRRLGGSAPVSIACARGAASEAAAEARSLGLETALLERLGAGEALRSGRFLFLPFDERERFCFGWLAEPARVEALGARVRALASAPLPVLVGGETGVGKEVVARALHRAGARADRPWIALNCAELSESLLESELFGHRRGAFTGALHDRAGLFAAAGRGTIFLDEIAELGPGAQAKLLRVLEEHRVRALGEDGARPVDCRVIAATNRDLAAEVAAGRFRADLLYRLRGACLVLPALRETGPALLRLAAVFAERAALRSGRAFAGLAPSAERALLAHSWPGNARELRQTIELAVLLACGPWIAADDLAIAAGPATAAPAPAKTLPTIRELERSHLERALEVAGGNQVSAARLLGLTRQSLDRRLRRHGLARRRATGVPASGERSPP